MNRSRRLHRVFQACRAGRKHSSCLDREKYSGGSSSGSCWSCSLSEIVRHLSMEICLCSLNNVMSCITCMIIIKCHLTCLSRLSHNFTQSSMYTKHSETSVHVYSVDEIKIVVRLIFCQHLVRANTCCYNIQVALITDKLPTHVHVHTESVRMCPKQ